MNNNPQKKLFDLLHGGACWAAFSAALHSALFDELHHPVSAAEIARKKHWSTDPTAGLLDSLTALTLLCKHEQNYHLAPAMAELLNCNSPNTLLPTLVHMGNIRIKSGEAVIKLLESQTVKPVAGTFKDETFWERATQNLHAFHKSTSGSYYAELIASLPEWQHANTILDIGAGSACLAGLLHAMRPALEYHIFDLPGVIDQLKRMPEIAGNPGLKLHAGDYNKATLPAGFDITFASMSLYYSDDLPGLMTQIRNGLNKGGIFVCAHEGLTHQRTQPAYHVVGRLIPAISGNNVSLQQGTLAKAMLSAGFSRVHSRTITSPFGPLDLDIGYC